jgi:hypothetical protein
VPLDKASRLPRSRALVAEELGWPVLGWKIAAMKQEMQQALRTDSPIYGRVYFTTRDAVPPPSTPASPARSPRSNTRPEARERPAAARQALQQWKK